MELNQTKKYFIPLLALGVSAAFVIVMYINLDIILNLIKDFVLTEKKSIKKNETILK